MCFICLLQFALILIFYIYPAGSYISIQHPVLVDLLGIERIVRSAGLLQIFIGFAGLVATPFAGMEETM